MPVVFGFINPIFGSTFQTALLLPSCPFFFKFPLFGRFSSETQGFMVSSFSSLLFFSLSACQRSQLFLSLQGKIVFFFELPPLYPPNRTLRNGGRGGLRFFFTFFDPNATLPPGPQRSQAALVVVPFPQQFPFSIDCQGFFSLG